jgi:hypothetical protein
MFSRRVAFALMLLSLLFRNPAAANDAPPVFRLGIARHPPPTT